MTVRQAAIANENAAIDASQSRAIAARAAEDSRPRNALEAMASRLEITPAGLKKTLLNTVFAECKNDEQFMALIVVSNAYGLNPLLKEIYAFPAKGGGIVPMVSIDGWIRLMNEHPAFNGIEFEYSLDAKGATIAIEAIVYRRDRDHPVKVMEFMEECKGTSQPWTKSPRRMLRHRALIQGVRIAFGFSGIVAEGDEDVVDVSYREVQSLPSRQTFAEELSDEIPTQFDKQTGEIIEEQTKGMTEVSEEEARALDAQTGNDGTLSEDNQSAAEGPADEDRGESNAEPAWAGKVAEIKTGIAGAKTSASLKTIEAEYVKHAVSLPNDIASEIEDLLRAKKNALSKEG